MSTPAGATRAELTADLRRLGLRAGDVVMAHGALRSIGRLSGGPDAVVGALLDAVSPGGTVLAYTDWESEEEHLLDAEGRIPEASRPRAAPFDPERSRAIRANGALPEFLRSWPGARRSGNPGASVAAIGSEAERFTADHPLDYGYGPGSPLARLVEAHGKVVMIGAPWDTMTLLHHAEHLVDLEDKPVIRCEVPILVDGTTRWQMIEEYDTSRPILPGLSEECFAEIVTDFIRRHSHRLGTVGAARTLIVDAAPICAFAVRWLEHRG